LRTPKLGFPPFSVLSFFILVIPRV
jgi:hypothetical protein